MTLRGIRVLITRPEGQAGGILRSIAERGGTGIVIPMIAIQEPASWDECDAAIGRLSEYDGLIFASANAARAFLDRLALSGKRVQGVQQVFAVGKGSAEILRAAGVDRVRVPPRATGAALAAEILRSFPGSVSFLLPRGDHARDELRDLLLGAGKKIDAPIVYRTLPPPPGELKRGARAIREGSIDVVTFASPSAVRHFALAVPPEEFRMTSPRPLVVTIGPTTAESASEIGYPVDAVADESSAAGLISTIEKIIRS